MVGQGLGRLGGRPRRQRQGAPAAHPTGALRRRREPPSIGGTADRSNALHVLEHLAGGKVPGCERSCARPSLPRRLVTRHGQGGADPV